MPEIPIQEVLDKAAKSGPGSLTVEEVEILSRYHAATKGKSEYESHKARTAQRQRELTAAGRDIGGIPDVLDPARRARCTASLERFLKLYFPWAFTLPWSDDHLRVLSKLERAITEGGLFAMAMPRGAGKTTISERVALWAILTGRRKYVCLIGATEQHAERILKSQMTELQYNDLLLEDFPEACYPIRCLENESRRCRGQTCHGESTNISFSAAQLVLPTLPEKYNSASNGSIITVCGITGAIRGQKHTTVKGEVLRPSFVLIDDPQTRESSSSESQCASREATIAGDVLGMAGPGQKISAVMPCTVIRRGDMADELLNRKKHPDWNGERTKMVYSFPTNQKLVDQYAELRAQALLEERPAKDATKFWRKNRKEIEAGAVISWPARKNPDEVSAVQHAINLMLRDRAAFFAEYQNEPLEEASIAEKILSADDICRKTNSIDQCDVAGEWSHVTAFVDVQKEALFWAVCAWGDNFSGGVIDYGCFPDQGRPYFRLDDLSVKLSAKFPLGSPEAVTFAGLQALTTDLCGREFRRQDGTRLRIERLLIDIGYETEVVRQFIRHSPSSVVMPAKGFGVKAGNKPMNEYQKKTGDKSGLYWRVGTAEGQPLRHVLVDTNYWKSFIFSRLAAPLGAAGCLSLFGREPSRHRMLADHLTAEYCVKTFGRGREVTEWTLKPGRPDNHWLDGVVGCAVAASMQGCALIGAGEKVFAVKTRVSFSQQQAAARAGR